MYFLGLTALFFFLSFVPSVCVYVCLTVLGGPESRGVLRKISDMLETILKRIDTLAKLSNTSKSHSLEDLSSTLERYTVCVCVCV